MLQHSNLGLIRGALTNPKTYRTSSPPPACSPTRRWRSRSPRFRRGGFPRRRAGPRRWQRRCLPRLRSRCHWCCRCPSWRCWGSSGCPAAFASPPSARPAGCCCGGTRLGMGLHSLPWELGKEKERLSEQAAFFNAWQVLHTEKKTRGQKEKKSIAPALIHKSWPVALSSISFWMSPQLCSVTALATHPHPLLPRVMQPKPSTTTSPLQLHMCNSVYVHKPWGDTVIPNIHHSTLGYLFIFFNSMLSVG